MLTLSQILPYRRIKLRIEHNFDVMDKNYLVSITVVILKNQIMKKKSGCTVSPKNQIGRIKMCTRTENKEDSYH